MRYEAAIEIARTPEDVFAYISDLDNLGVWQRSALGATADRDLGLGVTFTETRDLLGQRAESKGEVTAFVPGRELSLQIVEGPVPMTVRHLLEPADGGTRLTVEAEGEPTGIVKLLGPFAERAARKQAREDLERLKRILEAG